MISNDIKETFIRDIDRAYNINKEIVDQVATIIDKCSGNLIFTGVGKSALIGEKCAATFRSLGMPAFFLHSTDLAHGDLGGISKNDIVFCISQSGSTAELIYVIDNIKDSCHKLISVTGNDKSILYLKSDISLNTGISQELCVHNLAPTASTSVALFLLDCVAVECTRVSGLSSDDFGRNHPAGKLGKLLSLSIGSIMEDSSPLIFNISEASFKNILNGLVEGGLGIAVGVDHKNIPKAIFTDGDLRRLFAKGFKELDENSVLTLTTDFTCFQSNQLVRDVHLHMASKKIISAPVVNSEGHLVGIINSRIMLTNGFEL
jgi:arabinose-5-phosphate isomerase